MHFLLSNDDGYLAPGLACLAQALLPYGEVTVCAPEQDRSGASNSLTLDRPLILRQGSNGFYYVNGTPTDCVHLAATGLLPSYPDMVISGINNGANMGDDTLYSGTVAAAMEGFLLGIPAIAVSLAKKGGAHYATAARVVQDLLQRQRRQPLRGATLLNVNVPDVPYEALNGVAITRLGLRHKAEPVIQASNPRGETIYWVGPPGIAADADVGTDFHAIAHGQASITPLQTDFTAYKQLDFFREWVTL